MRLAVWYVITCMLSLLGLGDLGISVSSSIAVEIADILLRKLLPKLPFKSSTRMADSRDLLCLLTCNRQRFWFQRNQLLWSITSFWLFNNEKIPCWIVRHNTWDNAPEIHVNDLDLPSYFPLTDRERDYARLHRERNRYRNSISTLQQFSQSMLLSFSKTLQEGWKGQTSSCL